MRRLFSLTVLIFAILSLNSCKKDKDLKPISTMEVPSNPNIESPKWGQNDEIYILSLAVLLDLLLLLVKKHFFILVVAFLLQLLQLEPI